MLIECYGGHLLVRGKNNFIMQQYHNPRTQTEFKSKEEAVEWSKDYISENFNAIILDVQTDKIILEDTNEIEIKFSIEKLFSGNVKLKLIKQGLEQQILEFDIEFVDGLGAVVFGKESLEGNFQILLEDIEREDGNYIFFQYNENPYILIQNNFDDTGN